jgi:branched-chain amino acid transport system permease protein
MIGGVYALAASGLTIVFGVMRVLNLAHGELIMLAMYATYFLYSIMRIDPFLSILITMPLLFVIGAILYKAVVSRIVESQPTNQMLVAVGLMIFLQNFAVFLWTPNFKSLVGYRASVVIVSGLIFTNVRLMALATSLTITLALYLLLMKTSWGREIRACSQDSEAARIVGIDVKQIRLVSFGIGAALAGAAGSLIASLYYTFPTVGFHYIVVAVVVVVLGGMGSVFGALLGGITLGIVESLISFYVAAQLKEVGIFLVFILILLFKPHGLLGKREGLA